MIKKISVIPSFLENNYKIQEECEYVEDATYSRSIDSHVCMTCSLFDYTSHASYGSILCCNLHQKLIQNGQHLTHSCELYQKRTNLNKNNYCYHIFQAL